MSDGGPAGPARSGRRTSRAHDRPLRVAVLGVGLIGGSIGLAARHRLDAQVVGYDLDADALAQACELGAIDRMADTPEDAVRGADYAFVATPVGVAVSIAQAALAAASAECVVSDVGSTKRRIARELRDGRFVAGHPLAGSETGGVAAARADLFDGAVWYLTPGPVEGGDEGGHALARMQALVEQIGARPLLLDPEAHDRLMASVSHLPHVLANVLVAQALRAAPPEAAPGGGLAGNPSFRDATRVAGANTSIWTDIYLANADLLAEALDEAIRELSGVRDALDAEDAAALAAWNDEACRARARLAHRDATGPVSGSAGP